MGEFGDPVGAVFFEREEVGGLAQLGERLVCNQEVTGSRPVFSTSLRGPRVAAVVRGPTGSVE